MAEGLFKEKQMSPEKPSITASKVALNILTLGAMPEMAHVLNAYHDKRIGYKHGR